MHSELISDPEVVALRRRRAALLRQKNELIRANGLSFYRPRPKQEAFHRAAAKYKKRMVRAGNRFGKSHMGAAEDAAWLVGERTWERDEQFRLAGIPRHSVKGLVIAPDLDIVDKVWTTERGDSPGKIWQFLPRDLVARKARSQQGVITRIELKNGSTLNFETVKGWKNDPMSMESVDWDFIHVDEPCPRLMFLSAARGLIDRGGSVWFTLTPLREPWINDMFFPDATEGLPEQTTLGDSDVWSIDGSIYDNDTLSADSIAAFERSLTDDEKQCRLFGIPLHLAGTIYKQFRRDKHVLKSVPAGWAAYNDPPLDYSIYYAIDPHPQTPHAVLFCAVSPFGQRFYFDNIFEHCSVEELAAKIHTVLAKRHVVQARMDPLGFIEDPISCSTMAEELARCGIYVEKATKALAQGILKVQGELAKNPPALYFCPTVRRTLWEITRYCWDEKDNKPIDKDDHMMECLYRLELLEPQFVPRDDAALKRAFKPLKITKPELDFIKPFSLDLV